MSDPSAPGALVEHVGALPTVATRRVRVPSIAAWGALAALLGCALIAAAVTWSKRAPRAADVTASRWMPCVVGSQVPTRMALYRDRGVESWTAGSARASDGGARVVIAVLDDDTVVWSTSGARGGAPYRSIVSPALAEELVGSSREFLRAHSGEAERARHVGDLRLALDGEPRDLAACAESEIDADSPDGDGGSACAAWERYLAGVLATCRSSGGAPAQLELELRERG